MKQNERLLVYAVTGFLALILVIAVVFGNDPKQDTPANGGDVHDIQKLLGGEQSKVDGVTGANGAHINGSGEQAPAGNATGLRTPSEVTPERPLVAKVQVAREIVAKELGESRRDRTVRFVRARPNDSLESLVIRWCGSRSYVDEAKSLNEELTTLRIGQEVAVPWVDDEELVAVIEARQPRVLANAPVGGDAVVGDAAGNRTTLLGTPMPAASRTPGTPDFRLPGAGGGNAPATDGSGAAPSAASVEYTIKQGDALWTIAAKRYGKGRADAMVRKILELNPGLSPQKLNVGKKILLPAS